MVIYRERMKKDVYLNYKSDIIKLKGLKLTRTRKNEK